MARFGFSTETSAGGDFTPIVKYDARSGRMFRIDRIQDANGFTNDQVDITASFKACFDLESVETGWMLFAPGAPPSLHLTTLAALDAGGEYPEKPTPDHKNGVRFMLKLTKACGGDKPVREIAGQSKAFLSAVEELYAQYEREKAQHPGELPVVELVRTGSSINFSLSMVTAMSCSPMPKKPPTPITTACTLPSLSRISSLMSPSFSLASL